MYVGRLIAISYKYLLLQEVNIDGVWVKLNFRPIQMAHVPNK